MLCSLLWVTIRDVGMGPWSKFSSPRQTKAWKVRHGMGRELGHVPGGVRSAVVSTDPTDPDPSHLLGSILPSPFNRIQAVNIPADSSIESLTTFFSACGTVEVVKIVHKNDPK